MRIQEIAARIQANIKADRFLLCDEFTLDNHDMLLLLNSIFSLDKVQLAKVDFIAEDPLSLKGIVCDGSIKDAAVSMTFSQDTPSDIMVSFHCAMAQDWQMKLDQEDRFHIGTVSYDFILKTDKKITEGKLDGKFSLGDLEFDAKGIYKTEDHNWEITFSTSSTISTVALFGAVLKYMDVPELQARIIPEVAINSLSYQYDTKTKNRRDRMLLEVTTGGNIVVTDGFQFHNVGFDVIKWGDNYTLIFRTDLKIGETVFPLNISYRDQEFAFGLEPEKECILPSINDLGKMAGLDLSNAFPEGFLNFKRLVLKEFSAGFPSSFDSLSFFSATVATEKGWEFFSIPGLAMKDLSFGFHYTPDQTQYAVCGTVNISDILSVNLGAVYSSTDKWTFFGCLPSDKPLELSMLIRSLADMLTIKMPVLPIPSITIRHASVMFCLESGQFDASVSVVVQKQKNEEKAAGIIDKLFCINAKIEVKSELQDERRTYGGKLKGEMLIELVRFEVEYAFDTKSSNNIVTVKMLPTKDTITLTEILQKFGVTDIPAFVDEFDLGIKSVVMSYDIDNKILLISVEGERFGQITVEVTDKNYEVDIKFKDNIRLSSLPLVGTHLHLLDEVALNKLRFLATSKEHPELKVKSGVALLGSVLEQDFALQLYHKEKNAFFDEAENSNVEVKWFEINKGIKIFEFSRLGIGYSKGQILMLLDAGLSAKPIRLNLMSLGLGIDLADPGNISFYLSGIGIDFTNKSLSIAGSFLKSESGGNEVYEGSLLISYNKTSLFAAGMYSGDSLMVYAVLSAPIGGCPPFFITGLAAGFGYNIGVRVPDISQISKFPLISGAMGTLKREDMIKEMKNFITPMQGQNFLAAGIKFTSFNLVESFVLAIVSFGSNLEVDLLGLSKISVPPNLPPSKNPLAYAELMLKAYVAPESGFFSIMAQLTSESYIFSKDCKLSGGFAANFWTKGAHEGDFVITLGGYHPKYRKPERYPDVPRLGFCWPITENLNIDGDLYFALTPSVLMAGGRLSAKYQSGRLKAWFKAQSDFFVAWKPFHYDISISVYVGASYRIPVFGEFGIELGVDLHLWGPNFSGTAHISWFIISFTISFGEDASDNPPAVNWDEFKQTFLAKTDQTPNRLTLTKEEVSPITVSVANGLRFEVGPDNRTYCSEGGKTFPVVFPDMLELNVKSSMPSSKMSLNGIDIKASEKELGIFPMGRQKKLKTSFNVRLTSEDGSEIFCEAIAVLEDNVPGALWSMEKSDIELIREITTGMRIRLVQISYPLVPAEGQIDLKLLSIYSTIFKDFSLNTAWLLPRHDQKNAKKIFSGTVMSDSVCRKRQALIQSFSEYGYHFESNINLSSLKANTEFLFHEDMHLSNFI